MAETIIVELGTKHFQEANAAVRAALAEADTVCIVEAYAQRYLGCTLPAGKRLEIHGTPGNDLACYMDGGEMEVFGSAQDQTANTMNAPNIKSVIPVELFAELHGGVADDTCQNTNDDRSPWLYKSSPRCDRGKTGNSTSQNSNEAWTLFTDPGDDQPGNHSSRCAQVGIDECSRSQGICT